ncbi:hypothetical protein D9757_002055 [Collybiopsis confluens]|uniref:Uncharacterized protein n=1 Tax=Collybiopsis confluens TaxID=2823264 RepID=A0A8H5MEH3_9AGAR|nr:hypothetical protein D9757_002055 [Collybiopsis confluens]
MFIGAQVRSLSFVSHDRRAVIYALGPSMSNFPWARFTGTSVILMGIGYALMKASVPTEEELYNRMAPDLRRKVDAAKALREAREAELGQQVVAQTKEDVDPDAIKPIWADPTGNKK